MKTMIVVGCLMAVAGVGGWVWLDFHTKQAATEASIARAERLICLTTVERQQDGTATANEKYIAEDCVARGVVSLAEIDALKS